MNAESLYVISRDVVRIGPTTYWHSTAGREITVGPALDRLAREFAAPCAPSTVAASSGAAGAETVAAAVSMLVEHGVLVRYDAAATSPRPGLGLLRSPMMELSDALAGDAADVVVIGVPYDLGTTYRPGARFAPERIRRVSGAVFAYRDRDGVPVGRHDPVTGRSVLDGVRIVDSGDIAGVPFHRNGSVLDALEATVGRVVEAGRLPVVLGGDHSVTLPVVRGLASAYPRLGVLHVDAHTDYLDVRHDDWRTDLHHGNVMSWVIGDDRVERVVQLGVRQLSDRAPESHPTVVRWPGRTAVGRIDDVLSDLPGDIPYHVTIDVDGLDPSVMPATGTPLPGGFTHFELVELLDGLCQQRRVIGLDLVEVLPSDDEAPLLVAADLVIRVVDAATRRVS